MLFDLSLGAALVALIARPLGLYFAAVFEGRRTWLSFALSPIERLFCRLAGVRADVEQDWKGYASALMMFSVIATLMLFALMRLQHLLPLNPQGFGLVPANVAMNTAVSFVTNTNWQAYSGETTMSHLTQIAGLTVQELGGRPALGQGALAFLGKIDSRASRSRRSAAS
jgi:potassium-transporting ATPase potassium-binding subunit